MSDVDLLVVIPWVIFAAGVVTVILLGRRDHRTRRRKSRRDR